MSYILLRLLRCHQVTFGTGSKMILKASRRAGNEPGSHPGQVTRQTHVGLTHKKKTFILAYTLTFTLTGNLESPVHITPAFGLQVRSPKKLE